MNTAGITSGCLKHKECIKIAKTATFSSLKTPKVIRKKMGWRHRQFRSKISEPTCTGTEVWGRISQDHWAGLHKETKVLLL